MSTATPVRDRRGRGRLWLNWALALSTIVGAVLARIFALGAVMSTAACSTAECPDLEPSGLLFSVLYYGGPVIAAVTILVSFFTAHRTWGIAVPLCGWGLLVADVAGLAITFRH